MLSMSSDNTLGSSNSREWTFIEYGQSRSSTPDSSASSRLAAQLERSAYRRSRSNVRHRQNSNNNTDGRKSSRSKRLKHNHNQRNYDQEKRNNDTVFVETTQKPSSRRTYNYPKDHVKSSVVQVFEDLKQFNDISEENIVVTAQPVSSYTVEQSKPSRSPVKYSKENLGHRNTDAQMESRPYTVYQNGVYHEEGNNEVLTENHYATDRPTNDAQQNLSWDGVSKVHYDRSWEDGLKTVNYTVKERNYVNHVIQNDNSDNAKFRINTETIIANNTNMEPKVQCIDNWQNSEIQKENVIPKVVKETSNPVIGTIVRNVTNDDEDGSSKPMKLRQLIKIHEVQIAEVAKSAASMKKPSGKLQEGRLVRVTAAVSEIQNKPSHIKRHATEVFPIVCTRTSSLEENDNKILHPSGDIPAARHRDHSVHERNNNVTNGMEADKNVSWHSVNNYKINGENRQWKENKIGSETKHRLEESACFEHSYYTNGYSSPPKEKKYGKLHDDSEEEYRIQRAEPEIQIPHGYECTKRVDSKQALYYSSKTNHGNLSEAELSDIPPVRPPLPEHFYSSNEEIKPLSSPIPQAVQNTEPIIVPKKLDSEPSSEILKPLVVSQTPQWCRALPAVHVSTSAVVEIPNDENAVKTRITEERDTVLGSSRTSREMYEERLARIDLIPLDKPNGLLCGQEVISSPCSSLESFILENDLGMDRDMCLEKLKCSLKQVKHLSKEKAELEKKFEIELGDWKRKYEEQHKVANAYQKLEDRYRRRVEELKMALRQCGCPNLEGRKLLLLGQFGKRTEPYFFCSQTQSILDETEEWLKEQSIHSEVIHNVENLSTTNTRDPESGPASGNSFHGSSSDVTGGTDWALDITTDIDQYNGTSV